MKKTIVMALAMCLATAGAGALDQRAFDAVLEDSVAMWEQVVPLSRLGKAPALESWDPSALVKRIAADLATAGRYKEFAYLFEYLERRMSARLLEVRVISDRTPTPGFWPARASETRRAIVISAFDLEALAGDDRILRSSFFRALATLYYADEEPSLNALWRSRNVLNEFSSCMTGIWLESVYLLEILRVDAPRDPAPDWYSLLLGSAGADNLASASDRLFLVDMEYAYGIIRELRAVSTTRLAAELLDRLKTAPDGMQEALERAVYGTYPTPGQIMMGTRARTVAMLHPWALLSLQRALPASDRSLARSMDECLAFLRSFGSLHRYFDPHVVAERQKTLNTLVFGPPEPGAPDAASPFPPNPADAPATLPGAASERWYRWCEKPDPFSFEGLMPVSAEEASNLAAYRFSSDAEGRLIAVEYFVKGRPRGAGTLMYASRISVERDGGTETWRWENPFGNAIVNESGYALMRVVDGDGGRSMTFYMPDGRRVQDESGAWTVSRTEIEGGYELRFLDGSGLPWAGGYGYALDRRMVGEGRARDRTVFAADGKPVASRSTGVHRTVRAEVPGSGGLALEYRYYGTDRKPALFTGNHAADLDVWSADSHRRETRGADGLPVVGPAGFCVEETIFRDGLPVLARTLGPEGEPLATLAGYQSRDFSYDQAGNMVESSFLGVDGEPVLGDGGIHRRIGVYGERGVLVEVRFYGTDGEPMADETGAARIRWTIGPDGISTGADAWNAGGILISGREPGEI